MFPLAPKPVTVRVVLLTEPVTVSLPAAMTQLISDTPVLQRNSWMLSLRTPLMTARLEAARSISTRHRPKAGPSMTG